jgi:hypothetical protein
MRAPTSAGVVGQASIVTLFATARVNANIESMILAVSTISRYEIGGGEAPQML